MADVTSPVALAQVMAPTRGGVAAAVARAVELLGWDAALDGRRILVKINGVSAFLTPGANTSPWVLAGVLAMLRARFPHAELIVADSDSSARRQFNRTARLWGYDAVAREYGASLLNLGDGGWVETNLALPGFPAPRVSRLLLDCAALVNVPVMKTHTWSGASCGMKNLYGFLDGRRHEYHLILDEAILALAHRFPPALTVADGCVGLEAGGPVMGAPRELGVVLASRDVVAADVVAFDLMGLGHANISHCRRALDLAPGLTVTRVGEAAAACPPFRPARQNLNSRMHWWIKHHPRWSGLLRHPATFRLLCRASTLYQVYWFHVRGARARRHFFKTSAYARQFARRGHIYLSREPRC